MDTELRPHPLAECFPMLSDSELQELADDIKANGLRQKIMMHESQILDGRNRYAACRIAGFGIGNSITQYEGSDPIGYVISANEAGYENRGRMKRFFCKVADGKACCPSALMINAG